MVNINKLLLLNSANGTGDRNTRPIYWPGGEGELHVKGTLGGASAAVVLYEAAYATGSTNPADRLVAANYKPQGAEVTVANGVNRFFAGECWLYVGLKNSTASDNLTAWIGQVPNPAQSFAYYDDANTSPVA